MGQLGTTFGSFWDHLELLLAYEGHFGLPWGDSGTTLRFFLAYGGAFEVTLGSVLAYGGTFGMLLGRFGTSLRLLWHVNVTLGYFGVALEQFGVTFGRLLRALRGQSGVASSTLERLWGNFGYI